MKWLIVVADVTSAEVGKSESLLNSIFNDISQFSYKEIDRIDQCERNLTHFIIQMA